jgi:TonB family protein
VRERQEPVLAVAAAAVAAADGTDRRVAPLRSRQRAPVLGPLVSLALHLAVLALLLFGWPVTTPVEAPPIPVRLVFEPPPPPPPPPPAPKPLPRPVRPPPRGHLASDDFGDVTPKETSPAHTAVTQTPAAPEPSKQPEQAPPPKPPPAKSPPAEAKPSAPPQATAPPPPAAPAAAIPLPPPKPAAPKAEQVAALPPARPHPARQRDQELLRLASRPAKYPGPAATRDEYLHYLLVVTRRHLNLLPRALVGNRHGTTVIGVTVLDNGAVTMVHVERSSGYPDIDRRVEEMIVAVGRFPPLPQWFQGLGMPLEFRLDFPEALTMQP